MKKKFIPFREFGNIYGQTKLNNLYVMRCNGLIPGVAFAEDKKLKLVNVNFFERRKDFQRRVWLGVHDNFYFLTKHISTLYLSKLLHKIDDSHTVGTWNQFISSDIFKFPHESILSYQVDGMFMKFYRYSRWLIRALFIRAGVSVKNRDISVLLDRY